MVQKIAIPITASGLLHAHFGHCNFIQLFEIEDGKIVKDERLTPPPHATGVLPKWIADQGATDIISGGMGQMAIDILKERGVNAHVGAPNKPAKELVEEFLANKLEFSGNGCDH